MDEPENEIEMTKFAMATPPRNSYEINVADQAAAMKESITKPARNSGYLGNKAPRPKLSC